MKMRSWILPVLAAALSFPGQGSAQSFGGAVVVAGDEVWVGESTSEREPGAVYRFRYEDGWVEVGKVSAPDPSVRDGFGRALARSGGTVWVSGAGADGSGVVHVFEMTDGAWAHRGEITEPGLTSFGSALAATDDHLLVRALGENQEHVIMAYHRAAGGFEPAGRLEGPAEEAFGAALAVHGDVALVGAPRAAERTGAAYVYHYGTPDGWQRMATLAPETPARGAGNGAAVAIFDDQLFIGAPGTERGVGAVHWFAGTPESGWNFVETMVPLGLTRPAAFGASIALSGGSALVGAPAVGGGMGRAYALQRGGERWWIGEALEVEGEGRIQAGAVLAIGPDAGVLGLPGDDFGAGSAWVVAPEGEGWSAAERLASAQVGLPAIAGGQIDCEEGTAEGFDCAEVDLLSFVPREELGAGRGARLNDVWGWTDPDTGREYAIVGRMDGTAFVDVTDALNPRYLGSLDKTEGSQSNTWRDMKVFRDHTFIVADGAGQHGMQVFDLRQLRDVTEPRDFEETAHYDGVASSHNVIINEESGFAYLVGVSGGGETCGGGLHMVDINDPLAPVFAGCFAHPNTGRRGTGGSHDAQCVVYRGPDPDYAGREICMNSNETALSIADVTDKENPIAVSQAAYPNVGYAHQGWLSEDQRYFYSNDELDEVGGLVDQTRTLVWDVTDLDDPTLVREYYGETKVTDHNMYVRGDRLYMSNNRAGLRVLDISDPENPEEIGFFDTTPWSEDAAGFDGTWSVYPYFESGTILLSSRREGLFLVKPREQRLVP